MSIEDRDLARSIVLNFSLQCPNNGEIVFEPETEEAVWVKLKKTFEFIPTFAVNHEYGEVLNRFKIRVYDIKVKFGGES